METNSPGVMTRSPRAVRVYVKVTSEFDSTGFMKPLSITWEDGRQFIIQEIENYCPAGLAGNNQPVDCYTVWIQGQKNFYSLNRLTPDSKEDLVAGL